MRTIHLIVFLALAAIGCATDAPVSEAPVSEAATSSEIDIGVTECQPYDPTLCSPEGGFCEVPGPFVTCANGVKKKSFKTIDCRYCMPRDICPGEQLCSF